MRAVKVSAVFALAILGYLCVDARGYAAADRMSNGYHPVALFGAILELGAALWLLSLVWKPYLRWSDRLTPRARSSVLGAWLLTAGGTTAWTVVAYVRYTAVMPERLGSYFRFYFTPLPLWACLAAWLGTLLAAYTATRKALK